MFTLRRCSFGLVVLATQLVTEGPELWLRQAEVSYNWAMRGSPLANTISTKIDGDAEERPLVVHAATGWSCSRAWLPRPACRAAPRPSHTGRWNRVCVHAKIQGMARSDSMPPLGLRFDGRRADVHAPVLQLRCSLHAPFVSAFQTLAFSQTPHNSSLHLLL